MDDMRGIKSALVVLPSDFEPYGNRSRTADYGPDCSCDCKHFVKLEQPFGNDYGVCINRHSPRKGLLTFEHQGCRFFEEKNDFSE